MLAGSGAARAGITGRRQAVMVQGKPVAPGPDAERQAATMLAPLITQRHSARLTMVRNGAPVQITVPFTRACAYSIELGNADNVNAYNDGRRVLITRGMMNFAANDNELAYVLAKEMAHNSLNHARVQRTTAHRRRNHRQPDPHTARHVDHGRHVGHEAHAADHGCRSRHAVALHGGPRRLRYRLQRRVSGSGWRRMYPPSTLNGYTALHPATSYRLSVMDKILADVKGKQASTAAAAAVEAGLARKQARIKPGYMH